MSTDQSPPKRPRWVVVLGAVTVLVVLLLIVLMLAGGGGHGPTRHAIGGPDQAGESQGLLRL